ncbi:protealysin inhibitor emfourin [Micromonospora sp. URMC 105]|uniref:protealysin inhibitor emfourin n=1 Tax=Micromonospora sp. URMC 105 TaxID=3423413 RepID=UPI003F1A015C
MPAMLRTIGRLVTAFVLLTGVSAATLAAAAPARAGWNDAHQVTVTRTGGFAGVNERYDVSTGTVHVYTANLLATAGTREFRRLCPAYPAGNGADRFHYTVTVTYRNGVTKKVSTEDGADAPEVLWQVIDMTMQISRDLAPIS